MCEEFTPSSLLNEVKRISVQAQTIFQNAASRAQEKRAVKLLERLVKMESSLQTQCDKLGNKAGDKQYPLTGQEQAELNTILAQLSPEGLLAGASPDACLRDVYGFAEKYRRDMITLLYRITRINAALEKEPALSSLISQIKQDLVYIQDQTKSKDGVMTSCC
jgi:hypothetical protein